MATFLSPLWFWFKGYCCTEYGNRLRKVRSVQLWAQTNRRAFKAEHCQEKNNRRPSKQFWAGAHGTRRKVCDCSKEKRCLEYTLFFTTTIIRHLYCYFYLLCISYLNSPSWTILGDDALDKSMTISSFFHSGYCLPKVFHVFSIYLLFIL